MFTIVSKIKLNCFDFYRTLVISILNSVGVVIKHVDNLPIEKNKTIEIDLSNLKSGFYFIKIKNDSNEITKKIIKI